MPCTGCLGRCAQEAAEEEGRQGGAAGGGTAEAGAARSAGGHGGGAGARVLCWSQPGAVCPCHKLVGVRKVLQQSSCPCMARQVLAEEEGWKAAMARAGGQRVLDDPKRLSRCAPRPAATKRACRAEAALTCEAARQVAEEGDQAEGEEGAGVGRAPSAPAQGAGRQAGQVRPLRLPLLALAVLSRSWKACQACAAPLVTAPCCVAGARTT